MSFFNLRELLKKQNRSSKVKWSERSLAVRKVERRSVGGPSVAVRPDLAKFRHFDKIL